MANEALIKVNGVALSTPSDIKVEIQDLDGESVRPVATGVLRRNRIRSNMLKVTPAEFDAELFIPTHGIRATRKMYAGNKSYNYIRTKEGLKAKSFSFALIEV